MYMSIVYTKFDYHIGRLDQMALAGRLIDFSLLSGFVKQAC